MCFAHQAFKKALGVQEQVNVSVDIREGFKKIDISSLAHRCLPDDVATNAAAGVLLRSFVALSDHLLVTGKAASLRKKGVLKPFPFMEVAGEWRASDPECACVMLCAPSQILCPPGS